MQGTFVFDSLMCIGNCVLALYKNAANRVTRYHQLGMNEESVAALKSPCSSVPLLPCSECANNNFPLLLLCCNRYDRLICFYIAYMIVYTYV